MRRYVPVFIIACLFIAAVLFSELCLHRHDRSSLKNVDPLEAMRLVVTGSRLRLVHGKDEIRLRGVNMPSLEWHNEGEHLEASFSEAVRQWNANVIRLPLSQDRWFGRANGQKDGGDRYRDLVHMVVTSAVAERVYIVLDLHWSGGGKWADEGGRPGQYAMPDRQSAMFWGDVARKYGSFPNVLFDLYNEPHGITWGQWLNGGQVSEKRVDRITGDTNVATYASVGMQYLYNTVRDTGAGNVVIVSGNDWGYDLRGVAEGYALVGTNIMYGTHVYPWKHADWDELLGLASDWYAVCVAEWGCSSELDLVSYAPRLLTFMEQRRLHWIAWSFHPKSGPSLIAGWDYKPTPFGEMVKGLLIQLNSRQ